MKKMPPMKPMGMDMPEMPKPGFHITHEQMPEAKDWKPGDEYTMKIKVKSTNMTEHDSHLEITHYEVLNSSHKESGSNPGKHKRY